MHQVHALKREREMIGLIHVTFTLLYTQIMHRLTSKSGVGRGVHTIDNLNRALYIYCVSASNATLLQRLSFG